MATRNETNLAVRARVDKRVDDSASLVERMGLSVEQYKRVALNAFVTTPALAECTESSLDRAFMQCIMAGLCQTARRRQSCRSMTATMAPRMPRLFQWSKGN